jgi:hypothetical protein
LVVDPCSQEELQNFAVFPSPIVMVVDAAKSSLSRASHGISNLFHAFPFDAIETKANEVGAHVRSVPNLKSQAHL